MDAKEAQAELGATLRHHPAWQVPRHGLGEKIMDLLAGDEGVTASVEIHRNVRATVDWNKGPDGVHTFLATLNIDGAEWIPIQQRPSPIKDRSVRPLVFGPERFGHAEEALHAAEDWITRYCEQRGCTHPPVVPHNQE